MLKRTLDLSAGIIAGLIALPIILIAALAIKIESPGPIFFLQERTGKNGKIYQILKLRTMVKNASKVGPILTQKRDPRITRVGAFLRRTSLDELPQIINVLKGEMSLVGPRPEVPAITNTYSPKMQEVLKFKPGITGISQVNGRAELDIDEKVKMEVEYYKKATFISDLLVILKTPWVIITNKGNVM